MTYSRSFSRPLATQTATEAETVTPVMTIDDPNNTITLEWTATINAATRIFRRVRFADTFSGTTLVQTATVMAFAGSQTYVSPTNPADSTAIATTTYQLPAIDLDVFHTAAGDVRS